MHPFDQKPVRAGQSQHRLGEIVCLLPLAALLLWPVAPCARGGVVLTTLVSFNLTNGVDPSVALVQGRDGNFYGTTALGGTNSGNGHGTVFKMTASGALTTLYSFTGTNDGDEPNGLALGTDGNLYGTTFSGGKTNYNAGIGAYGYGTVFRISTNGVLTNLYSFANNSDGRYPEAGLVLAKDGNFYGTTVEGGLSLGDGSGTVFKVSTNGNLATLYQFPDDAAFPQAPLVQGVDGNLYGTAPGALGCGWGFLFKVTTNGTLLWEVGFSGDCQINCGCYPQGGLVQGRDGNLYGTTGYGGIGYNEDAISPIFTGYGSVFRVTTNGTLSTLFLFGSPNGSYSTDGSYSSAALVQGIDGNFYGTTQLGGANRKGTVFQVIGNNVSTLVSFNGTNGWSPCGSLVQGTDGDFYGTTIGGGAYGRGTVFQLSVPMTPAFRTVTQKGGKLTLTWSTFAGQSYQIQQKTNLTQTNWINLGTATTATNSTATTSDTIEPSSHRF